MNHDADDDEGCEEEKEKDDKQRLIREVKGVRERERGGERERALRKLFPFSVSYILCFRDDFSQFNHK